MSDLDRFIVDAKRRQASASGDAMIVAWLAVIVALCGSAYLIFSTGFDEVHASYERYHVELRP